MQQMTQKSKSGVKIGQEVVIVPTEMAGEDLRVKIAQQGRVVAKVVDKTSLGVCQITLPNGVSIPGYSHPLTSGPYKGLEFMDLHESHLALA